MSGEWPSPSDYSRRVWSIPLTSYRIGIVNYHVVVDRKNIEETDNGPISRWERVFKWSND